MNPCGFKGCPNPRRAKGLCLNHYVQQRKGRTPAPLWTDTRTEEGRVCTNCKVFKEWDDFYRHSDGGFRSQCKPCLIAKQVARKC